MAMLASHSRCTGVDQLRLAACAQYCEGSGPVRSCDYDHVGLQPRVAGLSEGERLMAGLEDEMLDEEPLEDSTARISGRRTAAGGRSVSSMLSVRYGVVSSAVPIANGASTALQQHGEELADGDAADIIADRAPFDAILMRVPRAPPPNPHPPPACAADCEDRLTWNTLRR